MTRVGPATRRAPRLLALLLVAVAALLGGTAAAATAAPQPKTTLSAMEQEMMCVSCRTSLGIAGGPQADAERREVRTLIAQGKTPQQIKDEMVRQYGERVLALPRDHGFNVAVYLVPIAVVLIALLVLAFALPRWRRHARARALLPAAATPALSSEDMQRLDADLARHD